VRKSSLPPRFHLRFVQLIAGRFNDYENPEKFGAPFVNILLLFILPFKKLFGYEIVQAGVGVRGGICHKI
jgi:hypothetical protein